MLTSDREFNNIKVHTQYSICEGAIKIDELASYCKANKVRAIGLADSYNLCGALEFAEKINKLIKIVKKTFIIFDLFLSNSLIKN